MVDASSEPEGNRMNIFDLWYTIHDNGDGSCSTKFFPTEELAHQDCSGGNDEEYRGRNPSRVQIAIADGIPHVIIGEEPLTLQRSVKKSDTELMAIREQAVEITKDYHRQFGNSLPEELDFTCDRCRSKYECEFVFDPYNTNGDCLAEK